MNPLSPDPTRCPLCNRDNNCQLCSPEPYKGECWCARLKIPAELLERIPPNLRNKACICPDCIAQSQPTKKAAPQEILPGDFYLDANGQLVFTAAYHLRRGHCCNSGCRHCPF